MPSSDEGFFARLRMVLQLGSPGETLPASPVADAFLVLLQLGLSNGLCAVAALLLVLPVVAGHPASAAVDPAAPEWRRAVGLRAAFEVVATADETGPAHPDDDGRQRVSRSDFGRLIRAYAALVIADEDDGDLDDLHDDEVDEDDEEDSGDQAGEVSALLDTDAAGESAVDTSVVADVQPPVKGGKGKGATFCGVRCPSWGVARAILYCQRSTQAKRRHRRNVATWAADAATERSWDAVVGSSSGSTSREWVSRKSFDSLMIAAAAQLDGVLAASAPAGGNLAVRAPVWAVAGCTPTLWCVPGSYRRKALSAHLARPLLKNGSPAVSQEHRPATCGAWGPHSCRWAQPGGDCQCGCG